MAYPSATNYPQNSGKIIPEIWSTKMLINFYAATCWSDIAMTDYDGAIKDHGDTVHIRTTPTIAIHTGYKKGQKLLVDTPQSDLVDLLIDKGDYYNLAVDDIDRFQSDLPFVEAWTKDASEQFKITVDRQAFSSIYADPVAANKGATAGAITGRYNLGAAGSPLGIDSTNAIKKIIDVNSVLNEQNVPPGDRWMVIPDWYANALFGSELKQAYLTGDSVSPIRNGMLGKVVNTTLYYSNLLPAVTDTGHYTNYILAGHKSALAFAAQFVKHETLRSTETFGDLIRGLQVWGAKTIKPEGLVALYAYPA